MKVANNKKGFTLIELVIVLAIAALILAGVLVAVGGAQRTQRDQARKQAAGRIATALENFASNNQGAYPAAGTTLAATYTNGISDPDRAANTPPAAGAAPQAATGTSGIIYSTNAVCTAVGGSTTSTGASPRNYAITYWSEGAGEPQCTSNR